MRAASGLILLTFVLAACSSEATGGGGTGAGGAGEGGAGEGGACEWPNDGGDGVIDAGMFACALRSSCVDVSSHAHVVWCSSRASAECASERIASGQAGVLRHQLDGYSGLSFTDDLIVLRGDGTAWIQTRHYGGVVACGELSPVRLCNVVPAPCDESAPDTWNLRTGLVDCVEVETPTCDELESGI